MRLFSRPYEGICLRFALTLDDLSSCNLNVLDSGFLICWIKYTSRPIKNIEKIISLRKFRGFNHGAQSIIENIAQFLNKTEKLGV